MKKIILGLCICIILSGCSFNKKDNLDNKDNNIKHEDKEEVNKDKEEDSKVGFIASDYFNPSKFDKNKFNGIVYDENGNSYKVIDLLANSKDGYIEANSYTRYYFSNDIGNEKMLIHDINNRLPWSKTDETIVYIKSILGDPTCFYDLVNKDSTLGESDVYTLLYDYGDYLVTLEFYDYTKWKGYSYKYPGLTTVNFITKKLLLSNKENYANNKQQFENVTLYGKDITK